MYRLIVVDDEPKHRRGLVNMIKKLKNNYEVFEARNGKEAFDLIMSNSIDILITDIKMPLIVSPALEQVWLGEKTAEQALNEIADKVQAEVKGRYRHTR